jgi:hypothetical protein
MVIPLYVIVIIKIPKEYSHLYSELRKAQGIIYKVDNSLFTLRAIVELHSKLILYNF